MSAEDRFGSLEIDWATEPVPNLGSFESYEDARQSFSFDLPDRYNLARDVVADHADTRGRVAMVQRIQSEDGDEREQTYTFWQFDRWSNRFANALADVGVSRGDRVAVITARSDCAMCANLATWKRGGLVVPLSVLYGPDGLSYRLADCDPTAVVVDDDRVDAVAEALEEVDSVEAVIGTNGKPNLEADVETASMDELTNNAAPTTSIADSAADDRAFVLYTSGTTGRPKGIVHDHQSLLGWLPGFQMCFELPWHDADPFLYATPDLAWVGGLNLVLGAWHYGFPVLVNDSDSGFDPVTVFENIDRYGPTRAVLVPGMLKAMSQVDPGPYDLSPLQVVMSGSEPVTESLHRYVIETLGANLNEMYGQTEAMHIVSSCHEWHDADPGSLGYPVPGHEVAIIDDDGSEQPNEETGIIGLKRPDPGMLVELWDDPKATERKFIGDEQWMNTDDLGFRASDGQFWYKSRADDLIITQGYRVGPAEVEDSILEVEGVANAGVIGVDDETRGEIVKAYVVPQTGVDELEALQERITEHVRQRLAKYQYPREIEFIESLPTTVTGKIKRGELEELEQ